MLQAKKLKEKVVWNFQIALTYCNSVAAHWGHYELNASVAMTTLIQPHSGVNGEQQLLNIVATEKSSSSLSFLEKFQEILLIMRNNERR